MNYFCLLLSALLALSLPSAAAATAPPQNPSDNGHATAAPQLSAVLAHTGRQAMRAAVHTTWKSGWTDGNYGLQVPTIWPKSVCYAAGGLILLRHPSLPDRAWAIRFGDVLLSLGAADWANEKHLAGLEKVQISGAAANSVQVRCVPTGDTEHLLATARYWEKHPRAPGFIVKIWQCGLFWISRAACPQTTDGTPTMCEGLRLLRKGALRKGDGLNLEHSGLFSDQEYWTLRSSTWMQHYFWTSIRAGASILQLAHSGKICPD